MKAFFIFLFSLLASVVSMAQNVKFDIEADLHRLTPLWQTAINTMHKRCMTSTISSEVRATL